MVRKLKTYVTSIGFFEEAIAAPSMKAALEAWGSSHNLFHQGFAKETDDPEIIAATMKQPGVILKRPIGSASIFKTHAELPKASSLDKKPAEAVAEKKSKPAPTQRKKAEGKVLEHESKAAAAFKRAEKQREQQKQKEEALRKKLKAKREASKTKALQNLKKLETAHEQRLKALKDKQAAINEKIQAEETSWDNEKEQLEAAVDKFK